MILPRFHSTKEVSKATAQRSFATRESSFHSTKEVSKASPRPCSRPPNGSFHSTKEVSKALSGTRSSPRMPVSIPLRKFPRIESPYVGMACLALFPFH